MELRGPQKHVSHHGHLLFEDARTSAVISGIALRKPNFFASSDWHTIPWESSPRNLRDELFDVMIALPDLLQKQDVLFEKLGNLDTNQDRFVILTEGQTYINRCIHIATSLQKWEEKAFATCMETLEAPPAVFAGPLTLVEVCKEHGYAFYSVVMYFWTACLVLYSTTWVAYRNITLATRNQTPSSMPTLMSLPEIPKWMSPQPIASSIVKCVGHYFEEDAGFWGAQSASVPMGAALHFLAATGRVESEEAQQLRNLFAQRRLGKATSDFLRSIANTHVAKGDPDNRREHHLMASAWFGTDKVQTAGR